MQQCLIEKSFLRLHCQIYWHFMCWKYFDEFFRNNNLLNISLTKFNELNKRGNCNSVYLCFVFSFHFQRSFSLSLADSLICTCFRTIFLTRSQRNVLWLVCADELLKIVCFYMMTFIFNVVTLIFCVSRIGVRENDE